jgi:hypothetical protein
MMLFALLGYQFPYTVMNRCLYLSKGPKNFVNWFLFKKKIGPRKKAIPMVQLR